MWSRNCTQESCRKRVEDYFQHGKIIGKVKISSKPTDRILLQVYMPTTEYEVEAVEVVYEETKKLIKHVKGDGNLIILSDWNAIVGEGTDGKITGYYGLGKRNERGERLVDYCDKHKLVVENILFQNHERRRYTWMMQGDRGRHQIDYVLVKHRFRNKVKNCKTYPGADTDSDHNKILMKCNLKFKSMVKMKSQNEM
jgi:exonuclease III